MTRKLTLAALIVSAALPLTVVAQGYGGGQGASPSRDTTPSGTTPATPGNPGAAGSPATPATPASPGARMGSGAAATGDSGATMFRELDSDKDGQVTKDEAKRSADMQTRFDTLDANHDGKVSMAEWNSGHREGAKKTP